jgi:hypothetical protein
MSHESGMPLMSQSALKPLAMSQESGFVLPLQSGETPW